MNEKEKEFIERINCGVAYCEDTSNEEIKEMAKDILKEAKKCDFVLCKECNYYNGGKVTETSCQTLMIAKSLIEKYRNVKDKVVVDTHKYIHSNKCYSDSTLMNWKKKDLIEHIRILEDNWAGAEERITNQGNYIESLFKKIEYWECDAKTYKQWKDNLVEELRQASELKAETIKLAKQETAREIIKALKNMAYRSNDWSHGEHPMVVEVDEIEELADKYEMEVE